jgi:FkbM family methyltransferase
MIAAMVATRWTRRIKRRILALVARRGYDVEKVSAGFPPYRLVRRIPLGRDPLADVKRIHPGTIRCVFDVGAHVGQSAALFSDTFPAARIHSFEPDPDSFARLRDLAVTDARVTPVNAAVGDHEGEATFFVNTFSQTSSLLRPRDGAGQFLVASEGLDVRRETRVRVTTLDRYCAEHAIERIDLLKLDTQGYELRVLDGAAAMLRRQAVPLIYLEVGFVPLYEHQPLFPAVYQYLYDRDYRLVWLYESSFHAHLFTIGANALFVHESIGSRATVPAPLGAAGSSSRAG